MAWQILQLSPRASAHLPPLLISTAFTADAYSIYLSDLTAIWCESLDRRAIIQRSREEDTSIDPSDGDQFKILLDKVRLGLAGAQNTALALTVNAGPNRPSVVLDVMVSLPGGLAPLSWPIRLDAAPQSIMTSQLTLPILRAQHERMQEVASLLEVLKEKDHVIQKVLDKLDGQGTDLSQIFPNAVRSGGRKTGRTVAETKVRGLALFDYEAWRKGLGHNESQGMAELIQDVFTNGSSENIRVGSGMFECREHGEWWDSIKGATINLDTGRFTTNGIPKSRKSMGAPKPESRASESVNEVDGIQAQAPHLAVSTPSQTGSSLLVIDNYTEDDDDDVADLSRRTTTSHSPPVSASLAPGHSPENKALRFGAIGKQKDAPKCPTTADEDESTDDEVSPASDRSPAPKSHTRAPKFAPKRKQRLGKIGGKKQAPYLSEPVPEPEPETDIISETEDPPPSNSSLPKSHPARTKKSKLGQIGGKQRQDTEPVPTPEDAPPPSQNSATTCPVKRKKLGVIGRGVQSKASIATASTGQDSLSLGPAAEADAEGIDGRMAVVSNMNREETPPVRETSIERADRKRLQLKRDLEAKTKAPVKKKRKF